MTDDTDGSRPAVLVVDDDADFGASLANLLRMEGYAVHVACDAAAAFEALGQRPSVALVDIRLGSESGVDLVRTLREEQPDLICVIVTAFASVEAAIEALQAGVYDYLCKPFYSHDLLATLARCFERVHLIEAQRRANERLQHQVRMEAIGKMSSGIAHDFNNILTVQNATLRWLQGRVPDGTEMAAAIEDALAAVDGGRRMTERLLSFGRIGAGDTEIADLRAELPAIARVLARTMGEELEVVLNAAPDLHMVQIARGGLESCLLNLALNARDAMGESGRLTLDAANVSVGRLPLTPDLIAGDYIRLSVSDTGAGMPARVLARAQEPLFTTKPRGEGSGLGLAMVDNFVRQSGGRMAIASEPGRGTRVDLYFPRALSEAGRAPGDGTNM